MTRSAPPISVVIPVFNGMPYIKAAIESALIELPEDGELIVRDNGSTDGTAEWLRTASDPRIRAVYGAETIPVEDNWNAVLHEARGTYVKLLCADDLLEPGALRRQLNAIQLNDAVLVASRRKVIGANGRTVINAHGLGGNLYGPMPGIQALKRSLLRGTNSFGEPASVLFRRDAALEAGGFRIAYPYVIDIDFYSRILSRGDFVGLKSVDADFRFVPGRRWLW